jgi:hypothetical protein
MNQLMYRSCVDISAENMHHFCNFCSRMNLASLKMEFQCTVSLAVIPIPDNLALLIVTAIEEGSPKIGISTVCNSGVHTDSVTSS